MKDLCKFAVIVVGAALSCAAHARTGPDETVQTEAGQVMPDQVLDAAQSDQVRLTSIENLPIEKTVSRLDFNLHHDAARQAKAKFLQDIHSSDSATSITAANFRLHAVTRPPAVHSSDSPAALRARIRNLIWDIHSPRIRNYSAQYRGGANTIALRLKRLRIGRRSDSDFGIARMYRRSIELEAALRREIESSARVSMTISVGQQNSRQRSAPILTERSKVRHAAISAQFETSGDRRFSLSAFDRGGWRDGPIQEFANRAANGETHAKSGLLFRAESSLAVGSSRDLYAGQLGFEIEQSRSTVQQSTTAMHLTLSHKF